MACKHVATRPASGRREGIETVQWVECIGAEAACHQHGAYRVFSEISVGLH